MTIKEFEERAAYQGGYDRMFDEWKIIDIHEIPDLMLDYHEVDFYCCNGKKVYLLRLRNRETENYTVFCDERHQRLRYPPYLIAELPILKIDDNFLKKVLSEFEL